MRLCCDDSNTRTRARGGHDISIEIQTHPIEPGQRVHVRHRVARKTDDAAGFVIREATWLENRGANSCWSARLGPFRKGDRVEAGAGAHARRRRASYTFRPCLLPKESGQAAAVSRRYQINAPRSRPLRVGAVRLPAFRRLHGARSPCLVLSR